MGWRWKNWGSGKVVSGWLCGVEEEKEERGLWAIGYAPLIGVWLLSKVRRCCR